MRNGSLLPFTYKRDGCTYLYRVLPLLHASSRVYVISLRRQKLDGPYDNKIMPVVLSVTLIVALSITFASSIIAFENDA